MMGEAIAHPSQNYCNEEIKGREAANEKKKSEMASGWRKANITNSIVQMNAEF